MALTTAPTSSPELASRDRPRRSFATPTARAAVGVAAIFLISPLLSTGSVSKTALLAMLPFASLTAIAAIGQTLVIQQRGLDLSIAGGITVSAVIVSKYGGESSWGLTFAIVVAILLPLCAGLLSGAVIAFASVPPLVVTIAANALLIGLVQFVSSGFQSQVPDSLSDFALGRWIGVPRLAVIALVFVLVAQGVLKRTVFGRRFELVGESRSAANLIGIRTRAYEISAYVIAGGCAGLTGVLLAGLVRQPTLTAGNDYLLESIAAVVLGGTALTGGKGSLTATMLGALFLGQLNQLVQTATQNAAAQNIVQASIIGVGIVVQLRFTSVLAWLRTLRGSDRHELNLTAAAESPSTQGESQ